MPPLFTPLQIAVASFIGGPVASCWLFARNYESLGDPRLARQSLGWGFAGTIALVALAFFLPPSFPRAAIPIGYTIGLYQTAHVIHGAMVRDQAAQGQPAAPWSVVFKVSFAVMLVFLVILIVADLAFARA